MFRVCAQDTFYQRYNARALEDVQLNGLFLEDLGKSKLLDRSLPRVLWRDDRDVSWRGAIFINWFLDSQVAIRRREVRVED
jgi:hypothetical protein